jgi:hypothetical protein
MEKMSADDIKGKIDSLTPEELEKIAELLMSFDEEKDKTKTLPDN